jgi:hypothetical protein
MKQPLTPAASEFMRRAKKKWGRKWRYKSADYLKVHPTTVWRWVQEDAEPPEAAMLAIRAMPVDEESTTG